MGFNGSSVHVDDRFHDVQPETQAAGAHALFFLLELIEDYGRNSGLIPSPSSSIATVATVSSRVTRVLTCLILPGSP